MQAAGHFLRRRRASFSRDLSDLDSDCPEFRQRASKGPAAPRAAPRKELALDYNICYSSFMAKQLGLKLPEWGGARKGAGRPRTRPHPGLMGAGVPHLRRADFAARNPVHVTMRVVPGVG